MAEAVIAYPLANATCLDRLSCNRAASRSAAHSCRHPGYWL